MSNPKWLEHPCPICKVKPHFACRDEKGFFTETHKERVEAN